MSEPNALAPTQPQVAKYESKLPTKPIALTEHVSVVSQHRSLVFAVAATVAIGGISYVYTKPPVYEGNLLVAVSDMRNSEQRGLLGSPLFEPDKRTSMSELEILRSRRVLMPVVERLNLDISAHPKYFPIVGLVLTKLGLSKQILPQAFKKYALGNEKIIVGVLDVPSSLLGSNFIVTKLPAEQYEIQQSENSHPQVGDVGKLTNIIVDGNSIKVKIDQLMGDEGSQYIVQKNSRAEVIEGLRKTISTNELGKESGIINVGFEHNDPHTVETVLNEIARSYMSLIEQQKMNAVSQSLGLLQSKLLEVNRRVKKAENEYESYREKQKTADFAEQIKLELARDSANRVRLADLRQKRAELRSHLGDQHPLLIALSEQIKTAESQTSAVLAEMRQAPSVSQELDRRLRTLQAETEISNSIKRRIEELGVAERDPVTNVRVVDEAVAPVVPKGSRGIAVVFALALAVVFGLLSAFIQQMFRKQK